jgi:hypothetical protein
VLQWLRNYSSPHPATLTSLEESARGTPLCVLRTQSVKCRPMEWTAKPDCQRHRWIRKSLRTGWEYVSGGRGALGSYTVVGHL